VWQGELAGRPSPCPNRQSTCPKGFLNDPQENAFEESGAWQGELAGRGGLDFLIGAIFARQRRFPAQTALSTRLTDYPLLGYSRNAFEESGVCQGELAGLPPARGGCWRVQCP